MRLLRKNDPARHTRAATVIGACIATLLAVVAVNASGAPAQPARSARLISLNEHAQLHLLSKHGFTLNERGSASGTIKGTANVQLKIVSTSRVTALITVSLNGGSISGEGTASYHKGTTTASFAGSLSIKHGSGSYSHAQGSGLSFNGTIAKANDAITVNVHGRFSQ